VAMGGQSVVSPTIAGHVLVATESGRTTILLSSLGTEEATTATLAASLAATPPRVKAHEAAMRTCVRWSYSDLFCVWAIEGSSGREQFPQKNRGIVRSVDWVLATLPQ
jgi:hypothetical protein